MSSICVGIKLLLVLLLLSLTPENSIQLELNDNLYGFEWCIGNVRTPDSALQAGMNWACGPGGADCSKIGPNQPCFLPNRILDHASYAYNDFYQTNKHTGGICDFNGTGILTQDDPSHGDCIYVHKP